jgi:hypothetical protein
MFVAAQKAKSYFQLDTSVRSFGGGNGELAHAQIIYECVVSEFPVTHDIWLKYIEYWNVNLKVVLFFYVQHLQIRLPLVLLLFSMGIRSCLLWRHKFENMYLNLFFMFLNPMKFLWCWYVQVALIIWKVYARTMQKMSVGYYLVDKVHVGFRMWFCSRN